MSNLIERLSERQPVKITRLEPSDIPLLNQLRLGYFHLLFIETGTELTFKVKQSEGIEEEADECFIAGSVTLDGVRIKVSARFDATTLSGTGEVEPVSDEDYARLREDNSIMV